MHLMQSMPDGDVETVLAVVLAEDFATPCIVEGCPWHASWTAEETLHDYCPQHADEWLMAEEASL